MRPIVQSECCILASAMLAISIVSSPVEAQVNSRVPASPHPHIRLSELSSQPIGGRTPLEEALDVRLYENAFVIHNDDAREVVGVSVIWRIIDADGSSHTRTQMMDEFLSGRRNIVIKSGGMLAVSPGGWLPKAPEANIINSDSVAKQQNRAAQRIKDAKSISASLDCVIFSDGEVWGPNASGLDREIAGRFAAAAHIAAIIRDALANGQDTQPVLKQITSTKFDPHSDYQAKWESRFAQQLSSRGPQLDAGIRYLEGLPAPPRLAPQSQR